MTTLGAITISDDMYLEGVESARQIVYEQKRSIAGLSYLTTKTLTGGRVFSLGTVNLNGARQGTWYQKNIDAIKALELLKSPVSLVYQGTTFTVMIVDTTGFKQLYQYEPVAECKQYSGTFQMIEV